MTHSRLLRSTSAGLAISIGAFAYGCADSTQPYNAVAPVADTTVTLVALTQPPDTGIVGEVVNPSPALKVTDAYGNALRTVRVAFSILEGGGTFQTNTALTNSYGVASSGPWTLGIEGENVAIAAAAGVTSARAFATAVAMQTGGINGTYALTSTDGWPAGDGHSWSGFITLTSDGYFVAESRWSVNGNVMTFRGNGVYAIAGQTILLNVKTGNWLDWAMGWPDGGGYERITGSIAAETMVLSWFVDGPDYPTFWHYERTK
jgi:hypothetical protein